MVTRLTLTIGDAECAQQMFSGENMRTRKNQTGFSLIKLLIVVAVILIMAAIAIPDLLRSRVAANEASAVASSRTLNWQNCSAHF
jgi:type II secretory pathway pseudopilin PulG